MKKIYLILLFSCFTNYISFGQDSGEILYPMNWIGLNLSNSIGSNIYGFEFTLQRKIIKTKKIEFNIVGYIKTSTNQNREFLLDNYNTKYGIALESNFVAFKSMYFGLSLNLGKHVVYQNKIYLSPRLNIGKVINKENQIVLEFFVEHAKIHYDEQIDPSWTIRQNFEEIGNKFILGIGVKKSIFNPKKKWELYKRRGGIIKTI